jgi:hypothetical protein
VHDWKERFLEESFALQMHMNFTYHDIRMMPVRYRQWYLKRLIKHFEKRNNMYEQANNPSKGTGDMKGFDKFSEQMNKKFSS